MKHVAVLRAEYDRLSAASGVEWKRAAVILTNATPEERRGPPIEAYKQAVYESHRLAEEAGKIRKQLPQEMQDEIAAATWEKMALGFVRALHGVGVADAAH